MNLYFWFFLLYAVLITPVGVQVHVRVDHGVHYRIRLRAAGMPFMHGRDRQDARPEERIQTKDFMNGVKNWDLALIAALLRDGHIQNAIRSLDWRLVEVKAHISFGDAAATAMAYAVFQTVMQTIGRCCSLPVCGRITADFEGTGTRIAVRCIVGARLGSITAAAIRLWLAASSTRARRLKAEEENYAAASH